MHIIAGKMKGLRLKYPRNIRPTSQKVREAIFSELGEAIIGANVLDLYAGSGALGIESLSRGAKAAVFVDDAAQSVRIIKKNIENAGKDFEIKREKASKFLSKDRRKFDLIFMDPPYQRLDPGVVRSAAEHLTDDGVIVVEISKHSEFPDAGEAELIDSRRYGDTLVGFYKL